MCWVKEIMVNGLQDDLKIHLRISIELRMAMCGRCGGEGITGQHHILLVNITLFISRDNPAKSRRGTSTFQLLLKPLVLLITNKQKPLGQESAM